MVFAEKNKPIRTIKKMITSNELTPITKAQIDAIEIELRKLHLLGTEKKSISELSKRQKNAFYIDYGVISIIIDNVNKSIKQLKK